jgi:hypothetical protein
MSTGSGTSGTKWDKVEMCLQYFITIPTQLVHNVTNVLIVLKCPEVEQVERSGTKWDDVEMCLQYFITIPTQLVHHVTNVLIVLKCNKGHTHWSITQDTT